LIWQNEQMDTMLPRGYNASNTTRQDRHFARSHEADCARVPLLAADRAVHNYA